MENRERQILSEIMDMMASIRSQLEILDEKMAQLQEAVGQEDADETPIDLDLDEPVEVADESADVVEEVKHEEVVEDLPDDDLPFGDISLDENDDLPIFAAPEPVQPVVKAEQKVKQAVIDSMTDRQAWRTDMPGTQVKDIRSAISLNDRILFINMLFAQDPMAFQDALTRINQMASLDEVVDYVVSERPEWDLESETVYRFMMAVRRKIR